CQSGSPALMYNSDSTSVKPIVQASWLVDSIPSSINVVLTWNGTAQPTATFSGGGGAAGDVLTMAVQAPTVTATGRYPWSMQLTTNGGHTRSTASGVTYVVVEDNSPFGAGWTFSGVDQLVDIAADSNGPAGKLRIYGTGSWRFYTGTSTFTSPAG